MAFLKIGRYTSLYNYPNKRAISFPGVHRRVCWKEAVRWCKQIM